MTQNIKKFTSKQELAASLADYVCEQVGSGGSLVLSGGSTPKPFLQELNTRPISWKNLIITLTDERLVEPTLPDSNEYMLRSYLTNEDLNFVPLSCHPERPKGVEGPHAADKGPSSLTLRRDDKFNIVILGMGEDGHFASIFPDSPNLDELLDLNNPALMANTKTANSPHKRITLTLAALLNSKEIILYITGEKKLEIIKNSTSYPIHAILEQDKTPVTIYYAE